MPLECAVAKPRDQWTPEEWRENTEDARRQARYRFAQDRIRKIVDGMPPLTDEQLSKLAVLLHGGGGE
jgi:hypothetical protein